LSIMTMTVTETTAELRRPTAWERICRQEELEPSWGEAALVRAEQIALFLISPGEVYAVSQHDPDTQATVMARGIVGSRGDRPTVASPLHKQVYDLGTGDCLSDPNLFLQTFRTRVVGGFIEVEVEVAA
jgi:nitrite reductase [NAD(P)H], small subunit